VEDGKKDRGYDELKLETDMVLFVGGVWLMILVCVTPQKCIGKGVMLGIGVGGDEAVE